MTSPKWGPNASLLSHIQKEAVAFGSNCLLIVSDGEVPIEELLPIARMTKAAASRNTNQLRKKKQSVLSAHFQGVPGRSVLFLDFV